MQISVSFDHAAHLHKFTIIIAGVSSGLRSLRIFTLLSLVWKSTRNWSCSSSVCTHFIFSSTRCFSAFFIRQFGVPSDPGMSVFGARMKKKRINKSICVFNVESVLIGSFFEDSYQNIAILRSLHPTPVFDRHKYNARGNHFS